MTSVKGIQPTPIVASPSLWLASSRISMDADETSTTTTSSIDDTISVISTEIERQRGRVNAIRRNSHHSWEMSPSSNRLNTPCSIMIVRTLNESTGGGEIVLMRKRRRRLKLKFIIERSVSTLRIRKSLSSESNTIVHFNTVTVREYPVIPGDNPSVSAGPPLTLDWEAVNKFSISINKFERFRDGKRRSQSEMKMSPNVRISFLVEEHHSMQAIRKATKEASVGRNRRIQTIGSLQNVHVHEKVECLQRYLTKPFRRKGNHRKKELKFFCKCLHRSGEKGTEKKTIEQIP